MIESRRHRLVHAERIRAFDKIRRPAVTAQQVFELSVADSSQQSRIVDLVPVQVKDREHGAVANRVQELVDVPGSG